MPFDTDPSRNGVRGVDGSAGGVGRAEARGVHDAVADDDDGSARDARVATFGVEPGVDRGVCRRPARDRGRRGADQDVGRHDGDGAGDDDEAKSAIQVRHWGEGLLGWAPRQGPQRDGGWASSDHRTVARAVPDAIPREAETHLPREDERRPFRPPRGRGIEHASTRTLGPMDLHVVGPAATPDERAAIDAALDPKIGPVRGGWDGGPRDIATEGHIAHGGHDARANRDLLLPALEAAAAREGWVSRGALNYISKRLAVPPAEAYGVASFYALLPTTPRPPIVAHVCDDLACRLLGAERICDELGTRLGPPGETAGHEDATWLRSPCLGQCERAPAVLVTSAGPTPKSHVRGNIRGADDVASMLTTVRLSPALTTDVVDAGELAPPVGDRPRRLLARVGRVDPTSILAYRGVRRLSGAAQGAEDGPGRGHRGGDGVEADGPRRGGVPDRAQVGRGRRAAGDAALPRLQRRRVRARHVQGPGDPRARPVRVDRVDDDRRVRGRRLARLPLPPGRVPARAPAPRSRHRPGPPGRPAGRQRRRLRLVVRHRAPDRRGRLHRRRGDRAVRVDRGRAAGAPQQAAVPGRGRAVRQADGRQQRRDPGQPAADPAGWRQGLRDPRHGGFHRPQAVLHLGQRGAARASTRSSSASGCGT